MDTITHGIVGALLGKALFSGRDIPAGFIKNEDAIAQSAPTARAAIVACTLGAMFPDIDIFAGPLAHNPLAIMQWHRGVTHSALVMPFWALLLAGISFPLARVVKWRPPRIFNLFLIYIVAITSHILLDLITNFGTMVWSPLRYSRAAWDWVYILDLTLTGIALVPQLAAWCFRKPGQFWGRAIGVWAAATAGAFGAFRLAAGSGYGFPIWVTGAASAIFAALIFVPAVRGMGFSWTRAGWCRAALAVFCAYIGLAALAHRKAFADTQRFAADEHLQVTGIAALPLPPTLTHWVGLISTPEGVWRAALREPAGTIEKTQMYANTRNVPLIAEAKTLPDVQMYLWFARFPVWRVTHEEENKTTLDISDVRFYREIDPFAAAVPQNPISSSAMPAARTGFTFEVVFDAQGRVLTHGFKEPE
jgi:membrane-bound metal-dependent hydrolase YbcI (DUF457 family)